MNIKFKTTEKSIRLIEAENTLIIETDRKAKKEEIKKEFEDIFKVKIEDIRTMIKNNKKYAYLKLNKANPAIDIATRVGII